MTVFKFPVRPFPLLLLVGTAILMVNVADVIARAPGAGETASETAAAKTPAGAAKAGKTTAAGKAGASEVPQNRLEAQIMDDLAKQRQASASRKSDAEMRERLLEAAEKRVDGKITELKTLESRLKELTNQRDEQENKQFASLVKVYETMKPKDAARIFEKLDLHVQIAVAHRMKEAKMAAILAEMSPDAAKSLTMALAERANVPG